MRYYLNCDYSVISLPKIILDHIVSFHWHMWSSMFDFNKPKNCFAGSCLVTWLMEHKFEVLLAILVQVTMASSKFGLCGMELNQRHLSIPESPLSLRYTQKFSVCTTFGFLPLCFSSFQAWRSLSLQRSPCKHDDLQLTFRLLLSDWFFCLTTSTLMSLRSALQSLIWWAWTTWWRIGALNPAVVCLQSSPIPQKFVAPLPRLERGTFWLTVKCSTNWAIGE